MELSRRFRPGNVYVTCSCPDRVRRKGKGLLQHSLQGHPTTSVFALIFLGYAIPESVRWFFSDHQFADRARLFNRSTLGLLLATVQSIFYGVQDPRCGACLCFLNTVNVLAEPQKALMNMERGPTRLGWKQHVCAPTKAIPCQSKHLVQLDEPRESI